MNKNKKKEIIENLKISALGFEGISIAKDDEGIVHILKGGVPGDLVSTQRFKKKKSYYQNKILSVLEKSEHRIEPECKYFGTCGGCSWQNMPYSYQLEWKKKHTEDAFIRQHHIENAVIEDIIGADKIFRYRNKMDFSFATGRWFTEEEISSQDEIENRNFALGLHIPGKFDRILDIDKCLLQVEIGDEIMNLVRNTALKLGVTAINMKNHIGFLRSLMIRVGNDYQDIMIILIHNKIENENEIEFMNEIKSEFAKINNIKSVIYALNSTNSPVKIEKYELILGEEYIYQKILNVNFRISPFSFFQTNINQLDKFIGKILEIADLKPEDTVWDLYSGSGSITLPASKYVSKIIGIELVESSINDAKINSDINNIKNAEFYRADLHNKEIPDLLNELEKPNKIILDPPRSGIHENLLNHLLQIEVAEITYVSCNPMTQARDIKILSEKYDIERIIPFDMFPQTYHIETIAKLKLKVL